MLALLSLFGLSSLLAPLAFRRWGSAAFFAAPVVPLAAFADTLLRGPAVFAAGEAGVVEQLAWIPTLHIGITVRMDPLSWWLALLVTGVGALVLFYCARYFSRADRGLDLFGPILLAFAGVMYGLVVADDVILLFIFWEATTVFSYLLIGYNTARVQARRAALQALIVTTFGGLAMLVGLAMLAVGAGTTRLSEIVAAGPELIAQRPGFAAAAIVLVLLGAVSKSALVPFHFWLPAAMAAPTPVSAYLHAAAMVKAGIYLIIRLAPGYAAAPGWRELLLTLGVATLLVGGYRALRQTDLKLVLAYGTVSQLGLMTIVAQAGTRDTALAALALLLAHGLFKATLFLTVGIIDHRTGTRDLRKLSGLGRAAPVLATVAVVAAASMAGLPPLAGFVAKEAVYSTLLELGTPAGAVAVGGVFVGSALTVAYSARFVWGAFGTKAGVVPVRHATAQPIIMVAPALLAALTVAAGALAYQLGPAVAAAADAAYPAAHDAADHGYYLALWHGLEPALGLSAGNIALGLALFALRGRVEAAQARVPSLVDANRTYRSIMASVDRFARALTGLVQRGSLPYYLGVIMVVFVVSVAATTLLGGVLPRGVRLWDSPVQVGVAVIMMGAAIAATRVTKRFPAVVVIGLTGYGMVALFALGGAPDLALTQTLVEIITLVAFVLVVRRLPVRIGQAHARVNPAPRLVLSVLVGGAVTLLGWVALEARTAATVSTEFARLAYEIGNGQNIVNVLLVDIRAWDTMGEIMVLVVAATGVASLVFLRRRDGTLERLDGLAGARARFRPVTDQIESRFVPADEEGGGRNAWLLAGRSLAPENRSILMEVATRLVFHSAIVFSVFLFFAGHNAPGGGFAGGLVAGLALVARYLAGGRYELAEAAPIDAGRLLGLGILFAVGTALVPMFFGLDALTATWWTLHPPLLGEIKFGTTTFFDLGVYLIVVGLVLDVLRSLGAEVDRQGGDA